MTALGEAHDRTTSHAGHGRVLRSATDIAIDIATHIATHIAVDDSSSTAQRSNDASDASGWSATRERAVTP